MDEGAGTLPGPGDAAGGGPGSGTTHKSLWKSLKGRLSSGGDRQTTGRHQVETGGDRQATGGDRRPGISHLHHTSRQQFDRHSN